ncbi:unnamed protein product [Adineta steineri]|uniref:RRM domain-containing protein n=1 Tax=Adineta steineri TaxID=433720 RepID=A0A814FTR3_9BILA|nr:unnamed protein product [Adineta steineri]CAF1190266.1 unnamed protein product [Adineta steineri]
MTEEYQTTKALIPLQKPHKSASKTNSEPVTNNKLFGTGLLNIDEKDLREHFAQFGSIKDVIIIKDRAGRSRTFGFVTYESSQSIHKCLKKTHKINGKQVHKL